MRKEGLKQLRKPKRGAGPAVTQIKVIQTSQCATPPANLPTYGNTNLPKWNPFEFRVTSM